MAKIDLKFLDHLCIGDDFVKVELYDEHSPNLIVISGSDSDGDRGYFNIYLDKSTAIKFAKTLRTEINKIVE